MATDWGQIYQGFKKGTGNTIYGITGYDPFGVVDAPDYFGNNVQRGVATKLNPASAAQYTSGSGLIDEKFRQAKVRSLQSSQSRGLQKSGFAQRSEQELTGQQEQSKSDLWGNLLGREQDFLNQMYAQDKQVAYNVAVRERNETLARQKQFQDFLTEAFDSIVQVAGLSFPLTAGNTDLGKDVNQAVLNSMGVPVQQ